MENIFAGFRDSMVALTNSIVSIEKMMMESDPEFDKSEVATMREIYCRTRTALREMIETNDRLVAFAASVVVE